MAKLRMTGKSNSPISNDFFEFFTTVMKSKTEATLESAGGTAQLELDGRGFQFNEAGTLLDGQLQGVSLIDSSDGTTVIARITDADFSFGVYQDENPLSGANFLQALLSGNDTIIGSKKRDWLEGFAGKDRLNGGAGYDILDGGAGKDIHTGGKGPDIFYFRDTEGNDVVTDFDAVGGGLKQDYFSGDTDGGVEFVKDGKNTLMVFENGTTITFLNVKYGDLGIEDVAAF